jgi:hypothetical protein
MGYRHSYFSLLFNQDHQHVTGDTKKEESIPSIDIKEALGTEKGHRRHLSAVLSDSLSTSISSSSVIKTNKDNGAPKIAVGTPDYLAPESILGTGQDSMVDWVCHINFNLFRSINFFFS